MSQYVIPFKQGQKILELGGGENPVFTDNADFRKSPKVKYVFDFEQRFPFPSESWEGVFSKFCIEHMSWRKIPHFISEIYRILKPNGLAVLIAPNTFEQCREILNRNRIGVEESALLYGGQESSWEECGNYHKAAFSFDYVQKLFKEAGFIEVVTKPLPTCHTDMIIEAHKGFNPLEAKWIKDLQTQLEQPKEIRLNIGSFTVMIPDFVNLDILDLTAYAQQKGFMFKQVDVRNGLPYPDQSTSFINSSHLIEHLTVEEGKQFLLECHRVLKDDMKIRLGTPDLKKLISTYLEEKMDKFNTHQPEEYRKSPSQADKFFRILTPDHKTIYDYEALSSLLKQVGFEPTPVEYNKETDMFPDHSLYVEALKTIIPVPPQRRLKIALISTSFFGLPPKAYSGLERIVWDLAVALSELGQEVTVIAPKGSQAPPNGYVIETIEAVNTTECNWLELEVKSYDIYKDRLKDFDIIHSHDWFSPVYFYKKDHPEAKICHTHHGHLNWRSKPPGVSKLNLIAISKWMQEVYRSQGFESRFAYNGIDLGAYEFRKKKGDRLLYVGRFSQIKQPHIAVQVAKRLNMGLDLVGGTFIAAQDKPYLENLKAMCDGVQIKMYPDASHEVKVKLMQGAKCLIFPSRMGEPFGLVAAEANLCGTPVVSTNDGAIGEVVEDSKSGYVCETYKKEGLNYSIIRDEVEAICEGVRKIDNIKPVDCRTTAQKFSRENMSKTYLQLYNDILEGGEW